jgi:hypothetical protein
MSDAFHIILLMDLQDLLMNLITKVGLNKIL